MADDNDPTGPFAGEPARRALRDQRQPPPEDRPARARRRVVTWLAWWVLMMSFWVMIDDSLQCDELLAGAGAAALAALAAEFVTYQADVRIGIRPGWGAVAEVLRLPGQVARDTALVFGALARTLVTGRPPDGGFAELPVRYGEDSSSGETRRVLLTGARSLTPNAFVLGFDAGRDVIVVHQLVRPRAETGPGAER
jgi:multisubunit Na+/H+ antiporter MnhE subunit